MAYGPVHEEHKGLPDVSLREVALLAPVLALLLLFGVYPKILTDRIDPSANAAVIHVAPQGQITDVGVPSAQGIFIDLSVIQGGRAVIPTPELVFQPVLPELILAGVAMVGLLYEAIVQAPGPRPCTCGSRWPGCWAPRPPPSRSGTGRATRRSWGAW